MIYPEEIVEDTSEANFSRHSTRSKVIYIFILVFIAGCILLLPWIYVEVGVRSQGMIRPDLGRVQIYSPVTGKVEELTVRDNRMIKSGKRIAVIDPGTVREKIRYAESRKELVDKMISDLLVLADYDLQDQHENAAGPPLKTNRYRRSLYEYHLRRGQARRELEMAKRELNRSTYLSDEELISTAELEESQFSYSNASSRQKLIEKQQKYQWTLDEAEFRNEQNQLNHELNDLHQALEEYQIVAPVSGSVQNLSGLQPGSLVIQNQVIAEISPDTKLIAEIYVTPSDIGMISEGMPVRMQIDAYNHNQWGIAIGSVIEISDDVDQRENQPVFKVRCQLERTYMELSNGYRGELKKGMTLQARFIIAKRSLFQLLHDKMDDWFNPLWS